MSSRRATATSPAPTAAATATASSAATGAAASETDLHGPLHPGLAIRLSRLAVPGTDKYLIVPMDHGISMGPGPGLVDLPHTIGAVTRGGASAVVLHKGNARFVAPFARRIGFCMHVSASTASNPDPNDKVIVTDADEALALGADAISTHTNFGARTESRQVEDLGRVTREAHRHGLPVLAMAYARGPDVSDPYDPVRVAGAARAAAECGADLVKTVYTGDPDSFRDVVRGCAVPILIAGGERTDTDEGLLEAVAGAHEAGAKGISIGRNVFQHPHPDRIMRAIHGIFVHDEGADDASRHLKEAAN